LKKTQKPTSAAGSQEPAALCPENPEKPPGIRFFKIYI
jgi:hypothetical protein